MTRKFLQDPDFEGGGNTAVEKGTYTVEVVDARPLESRDDFLWLDLRILGGPDDGTIVSVSLVLPTDQSTRGAQFYALKKLRGLYPHVADVFNLPDEQQAAALAERLPGIRVEADLSVQTEGQYKGSQQLESTRQIVDVSPPRVQATTTTAVDVQTQTVTVDADPPF